MLYQSEIGRHYLVWMWEAITKSWYSFFYFFSFYRAMHFCKRAIEIACRPSVCLSVRDVGGPEPHRLEISETTIIARTISTTSSLFQAQRPSTYSQGNMGKFGAEYRWGEKKWRSTKAAISLKRVKIEEKLLCRTSQQRSFKRYHPRSPTPYTAYPSQDWGIATPTQNRNHSEEWVKLQTSNLAGIFTESIWTKEHQTFWIEESMGVSRDCPIFWVPPITPGMGKATKFKFCTHSHMIDPNKSPLKISAKVAVSVLRYSRNFSGHIARSSLR